MKECLPPKRCLDCKEMFTPVVHHQKYCKACAYTRKLEKSKEYYREHKEQLLQQQRDLKAKQKQRLSAKKDLEQPKRKPRKKPIMTWPQIIKVCEENNISYGQAVAKGLVK